LSDLGRLKVENKFYGVARDGIEPPTQGFSVHTTTTLYNP